MSWNAYLKYVRNSIINRLKSNVNRNDNINNNKDDRKVIWINLPYLGKKGEQLTNSLIRKLKRSFKENIKFKTVYKTNKLSMFCNTKDSISAEQKSNVIYGIHVLVVFKNMSVKPIETSLPDLMNMVQKLISQCTRTYVILVHLMTILCYLHFQMQLWIPPSSAKNSTFIMP